MIIQGNAPIDLTISAIVRAWKSLPRTWSREMSVRGIDGIALVTAGTIRYDFADESYIAQPGSVLWLPKNIPYGGEQIGGADSQFLVVDFEVTGGCEEPYCAANFPIPYVNHTKTPEQYLHRFNKMISVWEMHQRDSVFQCKIMLYELLGALLRENSTPMNDRMNEIFEIHRNAHFRAILPEPAGNLSPIFYQRIAASSEFCSNRRYAPI